MRFSKRPAWAPALALLLTVPATAAVSETDAVRTDAEQKTRSVEAGADAYFSYSMAKMAQRRRDFAAAIGFLKDAAAADPASAAIRAELASTYFTVRDYPAAEEAARSALEIDSTQSLAHRVLAQLYHSRSRRGIEPDANRQRAMAELEASLTGDENDDPDILLTLGRFYFEAAEYESAERVLSRFATTQPNPPPTTLFLLARTQIQLERYAAAEATLARILELAPDSLQAIETLVRVLRMQDKFAESVPYLERMRDLQGGDASLYRQMGDAYYRTGEFEQAVGMFELALQEDPRSVYSRYFLALALDRIGRKEEARGHLSELIESEPDNLEVRYRLARLDELAGQRGKAVEQYRELVRRTRELSEDDPRRRDMVTFCVRSGLLLLDLQRYGEAVREMSECRASIEEDVDIVSLLLARAYIYAGKEEKALSEARSAAERFPGDRRFGVLAAEVLLHMGRDAEADSLFAEMREQGDTDPAGGPTLGFLISDAHFNAGALAERRRDYPRAETLLRRAIDLNPENGPALNYLGYTWADRDSNLDEALVLLLRAVALDPENGAYQDSLGWAYYRMGRLDQARRHLSRAAEIVEGDSTIQEHLGDLEFAAGNDAAAIIHWQRALQLDPPEPEAIRKKMRDSQRNLE